MHQKPPLFVSSSSSLICKVRYPYRYFSCMDSFSAACSRKWHHRLRHLVLERTLVVSSCLSLEVVLEEASPSVSEDFRSGRDDGFDWSCRLWQDATPFRQIITRPAVFAVGGSSLAADMHWWPERGSVTQFIYVGGGVAALFQVNKWKDLKDYVSLVGLAKLFSGKYLDLCPHRGWDTFDNYYVNLLHRFFKGHWFPLIGWQVVFPVILLESVTDFSWDLLLNSIINN